MSKKDYEKAARIAQSHVRDDDDSTELTAAVLIGGFVALFRDDNPAFDEARFRATCVPGANVKARPKRTEHRDHKCVHGVTVTRTMTCESGCP